MYPTGQQISFQTTPMNVQDPSTKMLLEPKEENQNGGGSSHAEFALFNSKRLQSDLETMGNKIKHHEDNLKFLQSQKSKLDESIVDLQVLMSKLHSPATPRNENCDNNLHNEDISEQILQHEHSAAGVLGLVQTRHGSQASQLTMTQGVVDIVAKLGKVHDENLSQILSDYLGTRSMLAVVCKNYDSVQALENYDNQGNIDKNGGLHGLGSSIGRTIEGHFDVICLENLRPFVGQHIADDPQRRLDLLKPKLPNGECPPGFLGFAVNMIQIDPAYLLCVTSYGYGLRETLFYSLFSRLQVYKTRVDMISALPCISDGAVSLDGGIIRTAGIFTLGSRDEVNVKFAKPTASRTIDNYNETEKQMKELKWKKEKTLEDIKREQVLREHAVYVFGKKKEEFVRFLAQSSSPIRMTQTKNTNYGLEESLVERQELVSRSRVVYEDATPSEDGVSNSQTVAETNSLNSTESVQETEAMLPMEMYFQHTEYTKKIKISTRCYITEAVEMLSNLKYPLREEEKRWFHRHPQFKHFFHIHKDKNHKNMGLWMLLVRTVRTEKKKEAWFVVNGIPIRYGITEHALISGLDCHNYPVNYQRMGSMDFVEKQFGRGVKVRYADVKEKLKRMKPSQDRLKMAVLYFLSSIIIGQTKTGEHAPSVEPFFLRVVDDLQICKTFPWGRLSFDHIMRQISHTMDHFHGVVKGSQWTMPIFCTPLELLAFEAISILRNKFREDVPDADSTCPRMCKTKFKRSTMRGFTLDEINEALGNTKDIESILIPSPDEKALVATISEKDNVDDDDDVVIRSWTKRLVDEGRPIFFEEMYNKDVASRADGEHTPRPEQLQNAPPTGLAVIDGVENVGLVELLVCMKKMDERFKKLDEKFDILNRKIVFVEEYVKEQLDARRRYEDMDYGIRIHETDLQEKDGEGTLEKKSDKIVEKSPLQEEHRAVDIYMENDEVGDLEGSKDNDEVRDLEEGNAKSGEISPLYEEDQDVIPDMDKNEECQPIEPKIQDEIELQTEYEKELVAEQQTEIESLAEPQPESEKEFIAKSQREPQSHLLQRTFTRKRKRNLSAL